MASEAVLWARRGDLYRHTLACSAQVALYKPLAPLALLAAVVGMAAVVVVVEGVVVRRRRMVCLRRTTATSTRCAGTAGTATSFAKKRSVATGLPCTCRMPALGVCVVHVPHGLAVVSGSAQGESCRHMLWHLTAPP